MTFDPLSPNSVDSPANQTVQLKTNFSTFASIFSATTGGAIYNHTPLNNPRQGDHESVIMTLQTVDPDVTNNLNAVYSKNATSHAGTQPQLFLRIPKFLPNELDSSAPGNPPMQLTYNAVNVAGPGYQSFLAGGYLIYFGTVSATGTVTLSPAPTKILSAIASANNMTSGGNPIPFDVSTNVTSNSTFDIISTLATGVYTFNYIAIASA